MDAACANVRGLIAAAAPVAGDEKQRQRVVPDSALLSVGFELTHVAASEVAGRLVVTEACCSAAFGVHGEERKKVMSSGVAALVAEAMAGLGGYLAAGCRLVAGVHMSVSHVTPAILGDHVVARARPVSDGGRNLQIWKVHMWRIVSSTKEHKDLVSTAKVIMLNTNRPTPKEMEAYEEHIKQHARL